jgi:hypothetical protein
MELGFDISIIKGKNIYLDDESKRFSLGFSKTSKSNTRRSL